MKIGLGYQALLAVLLGIAAGLFLGPLCSVFEPIGDVFIGLLQMVVLPYIPCLLIHGLGSLSPSIAGKLFKRKWHFLLLLWALIFIVIYALNLLIPSSPPSITAQIHDQSELSENLLKYLLPQNPFYDLANNIVPAIAIFGLVVGIALMHVPHKESILAPLEKINATLEKIIGWLALVSPIGIFAHISVAIGTVDFQDLQKLEFYVIALILVALFLTFWVLPMLLSCLTPFSYKEILREFRFVCLLPFATGLPSLAFPFINTSLKRLAEKRHLEKGTFSPTAQTVVPLAYSFAQIGNLFLLFFIFFLSFYFRHPLKKIDQIVLPFMTILMSFGTPTLSISGMSSLLPELQFPKEAFSLFIQMLSVTLNFQVLLSAAGMFTFILLVIFGHHGLLKLRLRRLLLQGGSTTAVFFGSILVIHHYLKIDDKYQNLYSKLELKTILPTLPKTVVIKEKIQSSMPLSPQSSPLERILKTSTLKVGYDVRTIPFCYYNQQGELVGYDIAFASQLAQDLDCHLELIPLSYDSLGKDLDTGLFDIAMSAILMNEERLIQMDFTNSYMEEDNVLVVPIAKQRLFTDFNKLTTDPSLTFGGVGGYFNAAKHHFPLAHVKKIDSMEALVQGKVDAVLWSNISAFIWCLSRPQFTPIKFQSQLGQRFFAYPVKNGSYEWTSFINHWLDLKEQMGFTDQQKEYWFEGKLPEKRKQRWSIAKDILHWF